MKIETSDLSSAQYKITISPITNPSTKGAIDGVSFPSERTMRVSAYNNVNEGTSDNFFSNTVFAKSSTGSSWTGDKFWPIDGTLDFLAISTDGLTISGLSYEDNVADGVSFMVPDNSSIQTDILYASAREQSRTSSGTPLNFHHAGSLVVFTASSTVSYDAAKNKGVTIKYIVLNNAKYSGRLAITADRSGNSECSWSSLSVQKDVNLLSGGSDLLNYNVPETAMDITVAGNHFGIGGHGILVPSQSQTSFTVYYTVHNGLNGSGNPVDNEFQYTYVFSDNWRDGKKYCYQMKFNLKQMEVKPEVIPTVVDWDDETYTVSVESVHATYTVNSVSALTLPLLSLDSNTEVIIDWGDGTFETLKATEAKDVTPEHIYLEPYTGPVNISVKKGVLSFVDLTEEQKASVKIYDEAHVKFKESKVEPNKKIYYTTSNGNTFSPSGKFYAEDGSEATIVSNVYDTVGVLTFNKPVTYVGDNGFKNATKLTSITLPEGVVRLGNYVFRELSNLTEVTLPESLSRIGDQVFLGTSISNLVIPDNVGNNIGTMMCYGCASLKSVKLPSTIIDIPGESFTYCSALTDVIIPDSVESIQASAFQGCVSLDITLPKNLIIIGMNACLGVSIKNLVIPDGVTNIGYNAFYYCDLLKSVKMSDNVEDLGGEAFSSCSALTDIILSNGLSELPEGIFSKCSSLKSLEIPASITTIGDRAFESTDNLTEVTCLNTTPPTLGSDIASLHQFDLYVPAGTVEAYQATDWALYAKSISEVRYELSKPGMANCYIVTEPGSYKFRADVMPVSQTALESPVSAEVLWEYFGDKYFETYGKGSVITNASFENGYVFFDVPSKMRNGNSVIAVKDEDGEILWSWHIWNCIGYDIEATAQVYKNNAGTMMDRNLGECPLNSSDQSCVVYQWGRKDPFPYHYSYSLNMTSSNPFPEPESYTVAGQIDYTIAHPMTMILGNYYGGWMYGECDAAGRWLPDTKTDYDPCPYGWKVPKGGLDGVWRVAAGADTSTEGTWSPCYPRGKNLSGVLVETGKSCFYRAFGYGNVGWLTYSDHVEPFWDFHSYTTGFVWTSSYADADPGNAKIFSTSESISYFNNTNGMSTANGAAVRCIKIN